VRKVGEERGRTGGLLPWPEDIQLICPEYALLEDKLAESRRLSRNARFEFIRRFEIWTILGAVTMVSI